MECPVCLEKIAHKPDNKRYAILTSCTHIFCMSCIYTWKKNTPTCPICRTKIGFIIPFKKPCAPRSSRRQYIIDAYFKRCKQIVCKYETETSKCHFGNHCLYSHP
ncbi:RING E3 ubiquitin ligase [European chub iridovirus]|nr:RING E3 ubiquitin ligase [European chub iridovirus]